MGSPSTVVTRQFIRLPVTISILVVTTGSAGGTWPLRRHGRVERVQAVAAAKGGWPVCDPVLRLAGAAFGGSKETSTTVCGDEGRCVVCNLRKAGCSLIAYCCTTVCGDEGKCVVCNLRKAGCSLIADCCDGDRHGIERDSRGLAGGLATPRLWRQVLRGCV